ncbi:hypothetical protein LCGC14_0249890 [marine sediment metagenome]|uniref:Uncharacterized protein n=1 Tax=marine sediment metagenome TaxID=412755 RepID=A0A0F9WQE6_9ZZZZ
MKHGKEHDLVYANLLINLRTQGIPEELWPTHIRIMAETTAIAIAEVLLESITQRRERKKGASDG